MEEQSGRLPTSHSMAKNKNRRCQRVLRVSWPANLQSEKYDRLTSAMDIFPTAMPLLEKEAMPKPFDGVNLCPSLQARMTQLSRHLVLEKLEAKSVRKGEWKLILSEGLEPMLFNLATDLKERQNLALQCQTKSKNSPTHRAMGKGAHCTNSGEKEKFTEVRKRNSQNSLKPETLESLTS